MSMSCLDLKPQVALNRHLKSRRIGTLKIVSNFYKLKSFTGESIKFAM